MGKKLDDDMSRKVLEYIEVQMPPANGKPGARVPRIVTPRTLTLNQVVNRAVSQGYTLGQPNFFKAQFESVMAAVMDCLAEGNAVNLGGYFRIQPHLQGKVNAEGLLTRKNRLCVRVTTLAKMKMNITDFSWRRQGGHLRPLESE